jgi:hypothetical protein
MPWGLFGFGLGYFVLGLARAAQELWGSPPFGELF